MTREEAIKISDVISRKAAIDALKEHRALYCDNTPETFSKLSYAEKSRVDELDAAIATLVNLPSADRPKWIPVTKALPTKGVKVLVQTSYPNLMYVAEIGSFLSQPEGWRTADGYEKIEQTVAWMPLPEPYKESEE